LNPRHGQGPFDVLVGAVVFGDLVRPPCDVGAVEHLLPDRRDPLRVPNRLAVRSGLASLVEVAVSQLGRIDAEQGGASAEDVLDHEHALRAAEAAERGLRCLVRLGDPPVHAHVRDPVGVVDVAQRSGEHWLG
jgi:hypothetical protein